MRKADTQALLLKMISSQLYVTLHLMEQKNNPLHGKTLEMILKQLVAHYTWAGLGDRIEINCFNIDPSISSSLRFLRKTDWARTKVERLYLETDFTK